MTSRNMSTCFEKIHIEDGTVFILNTDGTYVLNCMSCDNTDKNNTVHSKGNSYLLQCYSNGYINKVSLSDILQLRKNYTYSHGIFTGVKLQYFNVSTNDDFIIALFEKEGKEYITIRSAAALSAHSMLGLKGDSFVKTTFDIIRNWFILSNEQSHNVPTIIALCSHNGYISTENQECSNELLWINSNVFKIQELQTQDSEQSEVIQKPEAKVSDEGFDFSTLLGKENESLLRAKFSSYLKSGRNIPVGQGHVRDILSICRNKEDFWLTITCLLECSVKIYRSPIIVYFKNNPDYLYFPNEDTLESITNLLFSTEEKTEKNLEFLYPFKGLLTGNILSVIQNKIGELPNPEYYHLYGELLNYSSQDLIEYCLRKGTAASYYCIYEILQQISKRQDHSSVRKLATSISNQLDERQIEGKLIKSLILNDFKKHLSNLTPELIVIKTGGFTEYQKSCNSYHGKKEYKDVLKSLSSFVGKRLKARYVSEYQNHYYLMVYPGVRVLLPKQMAIEKLTDGSIVEVYIAYADKAYETLYATQKQPAYYAKIIDIPLLNNGDIIEVTFDINRKPISHKCYKKIKISLDSQTKPIDYHFRYKAKVVRKLQDNYHYAVKLIN